MHREKKIIAAISAAIVQYFQAEQAAGQTVVGAMAWQEQERMLAQSGCLPSIWAMAGRQFVMEKRQFLQLRMVR